MKQEILNTLNEKYGSLENPTYFFIDKALKENPYKLIIENLTKKFKSVEDQTDIDCDICFSYTVYGRKNHWSIELSMVAPYGIVVRFKGDHLLDLLLNDEKILTEEEVEILEELKKGGIELLSSVNLLEIVPLNTELEEDAKDQLRNVRLYNALFSTSHPLPWRITD